MRTFFTILLLNFIWITSNGQYYIKGDVKDEKDQPLQNVKIYVPSTRSIYYSGTSGGFGIPSSLLYDSFFISKDGYKDAAIRIKADEYQGIVLKPLPGQVASQKNKLVSLTEGKEGSLHPMAYYNGESYSNLVENDFIKTNKDYKTTFSMRIDKASYSNIRRFINQDSKVPVNAVRIDEMLNYFNFNYKQPAGNNTFNIESQVTDCPWNKDHRLLYINLSAKKINLDKVPPSNFVFLIDVSGSMDLPNRLPLLKEAFQLLVKNLREKDTVSIVVYGGSVGIKLPPTSGAEKVIISKAVEELTASGDTPGEAAIRMAYQLASNTFIEGGNNRIILATDGDFNIGQTSEKELEKLITQQKETGVYLTCLGVGMGNYKDSKIEILAKKGNGNFAYIDDIREAEKVMVTEFTQTLYSIASDVSISMRFNKDVVKEYRLIGYDNKRNILAENGNELEGGEIGSGSGNTILFEWIPNKTDSLVDTMELASLTLNYKLPDEGKPQQLNYSVKNNYTPFLQIDTSLQLATAVAMFGLKLQKSQYFPEIEWEVIKYISPYISLPGNYLKNEFLGLIEKVKVIYFEKKKKGRRRGR